MQAIVCTSVSTGNRPVSLAPIIAPGADAAAPTANNRHSKAPASPTKCPIPPAIAITTPASRFVPTSTRGETLV